MYVRSVCELKCVKLQLTASESPLFEHMTVIMRAIRLHRASLLAAVAVCARQPVLEWTVGSVGSENASMTIRFQNDDAAQRASRLSSRSIASRIEDETQSDSVISTQHSQATSSRETLRLVLLMACTYRHVLLCRKYAEHKINIVRRKLNGDNPVHVMR